MIRRILRPAATLAVAATLLTAAGGYHGRVAPVAQASVATDDVPLSFGCNNVALTFAGGTPLATVAAGVAPSSALESIWRYDNASGKFFGFSTLPGAPNDYTSILMRLEPVFVCVRDNATLTRPTV